LQTIDKKLGLIVRQEVQQLAPKLIGYDLQTHKYVHIPTLYFNRAMRADEGLKIAVLQVL
jgi:hypothetical protein